MYIFLTNTASASEENPNNNLMMTPAGLSGINWQKVFKKRFIVYKLLQTNNMQITFLTLVQDKLAFKVFKKRVIGFTNLHIHYVQGLPLTKGVQEEIYCLQTTNNIQITFLTLVQDKLAKGFKKRFYLRAPEESDSSGNLHLEDQIRTANT